MSDVFNEPVTAPPGHEYHVRIDLSCIGSDATERVVVMADALEEAGFSEESRQLKEAARKAQQHPFRPSNGWTRSTSDSMTGDTILHYFKDISTSVCTYRAQAWQENIYNTGRISLNSQLYDRDVAMAKFTIAWRVKGDKYDIEPRLCRRCLKWCNDNGVKA